MLSAILFGIAPTILKLTYNNNNSSLNAVFLRSLVVLPFLFAPLHYKKLQIIPAREELKLIVSKAGLGLGVTGILLSASYIFIPVGIATVLHFAYPAVVALLGWTLYKEKLNPSKVIALVLCIIGIGLFFEPAGNLDIRGIILALLSGCTFAYYVQSLSKTKLKEMNLFRLTFYTNCMSTLVSGVAAGVSGTINFRLSMGTWLLLILGGIMVSLLGTTLFQLGVRSLGSLTASILSTLEPITSVVISILVLGETLTYAKWGGCIVILISVIYISLAETGKVRI